MNARAQYISDLFSGSDSVKRVLRLVLFAIFTAVSAQLAVRLPFTPVPVTMQTLFVALAGIMLGSRDGFYSVALYVSLGAAGLPWFANFSGGPMILVGPTGGYIAAFPFAAWLAGKVVESFQRSAFTVFTASVLSSSAIVFLGALYLSAVFSFPLSTAIALGVTPFLAVELLKAALAVLIAGKLFYKSSD